MTEAQFLAMLALVGAVIVVSALLSGFIDRSRLPHVAVFLVMGAMIGPAGLNLLNATTDSQVLRTVSTLSLVLVLFTDALSLNFSEIRRNALLSFLMVGPGTLFSAVLMAIAAWGLLGLSPALAAMLGAALASTDPVLLRAIVRGPDIDPSVKQALRIEGGMNDAVLLPILLIAISLSPSFTGGHSNAGHVAINVLLLGPAAGVVVGLVSVAALDLIRKRVGVRRDYESLYSLGVAFLAFAAAEAVHGSGFLAAFAAGLTVSALDVELCDCFLEYGQTTAEMALLFTFVLFGTSIIWSGLKVASLPVLLFVAAVFLARPLAFLPALSFTRLRWRDKLLISWFGPRGLSSLLLVMLVIVADVPGAQYLLQVCCLVVLVSVVLHGFSPILIFRKPGARGAAGSGTPESPTRTAEATPASIASSTQQAVSSGSNDALRLGLTGPEYVSMADVKNWRAQGVPFVLFDSRSVRTFDDSDLAPEGAVRAHPDHAVKDVEKLGIPKEAALVVFCA